MSLVPGGYPKACACPCVMIWGVENMEPICVGKAKVIAPQTPL